MNTSSVNMFDLGHCGAQGFFEESLDSVENERNIMGNFEGRVLVFCLDDLNYRQIDMHKFILQGYANQLSNEQNADARSDEYNMRAPESQKQK